MKRRNHGFQISWLVVWLVEVLVVYELSLADTGVLVHRKDNQVNWQWLTTYKLSAGSGWSRQGNTGRYVVCDIPSTLANHTNSWLISDFIQSDGANEVVTSLTFTTRLCPDGFPYCVQYFKLFALFADNEISGGVPVNLLTQGDISFVDNVTASVTWNGSVTPQDNRVNLTFLLPKKGLYLIFQDIGACVSLREVSVTYKYCPLVTTNGVTYNKTFSPALRDGEKSVTGECLDNASGFLKSSLLVGKCLANGEWKIDDRITCLCNPGYQMQGGKCQGCHSETYKSSHGNQACSQCARHAHPSISRDGCDCDTGYYRAADDPINSSCTAPPSPPVDLRATVKAQEVAIVIWLPPINNGGRNDIRYDVVCRQCIRGDCDVTCDGVSFWPAKQNLSWTQVVLTGVKSKASYRITILAKNGVSDIARVNYHGNASVTLTIPGYSTAGASTNGTTAKVADNPSNSINTAIGVSVACTFLFCLIVGLVIAAYLIRKQRNTSKVSADNYKTQRRQSNTTDETELQSVQQESTLNSLFSGSDVKEDSIFESSEDNKNAVPDAMVKGTSLDVPNIANTWCHDKNEDISVLQIPQSESPAKEKMGSFVSVRSWFPQEDVQYGI